MFLDHWSRGWLLNNVVYGFILFLQYIDLSLITLAFFHNITNLCHQESHRIVDFISMYSETLVMKILEYYAYFEIFGT